MAVFEKTARSDVSGLSCFYLLGKRKPAFAAPPPSVQLQFVINSMWALTPASLAVGLDGLLGCTSMAFTQILSLQDTNIHRFDNTFLLKIILVSFDIFIYLPSRVVKVFHHHLPKE